MELNVGGPDRIIRLVAGTALLLAGVAGYIGVLRLAFGPVPQALASVIALLVGLILFATGIARKCPINRALGVNTFRSSREERDASERPR